MFDFDSITLLISMVCLVAFAIPFIIYSKKAKSQNSQKKAKLDEFLQANQFNLTVQETWRDRYFLGIDPVKRALVFVENLDAFEPQVFNLDDVHQVVKHEVSRMIGTGKNQRKIVDELHLQLIGKSGRLKTSIEVYNGEVFSDLLGEPVLIQKLEALLKDYKKSTDKLSQYESTGAHS